MQPLGGTTEVQLVGHGQKRAQLFNIHGVGLTLRSIASSVSQND
jgi:hypothetical protein